MSYSAPERQSPMDRDGGRSATVTRSVREITRKVIREVLAASCACGPDDFLRAGVTFTIAEEHPGRLRFPMPSKPLLVATMGSGVVVSVAPDRLRSARSALAGLDRDAIFSAEGIAGLNEVVEPAGQYLVGPVLKYACSAADLRPAGVPDGIQVDLLEASEVSELYHHGGFDHALSYRSDGPRPDVLATAASRSGKVVGVAAASADCDRMWQIGIEVLESERRAGVGQALVSQLTAAILDRGVVPYYSTTVSNLASRTLAVSLGYWPAWTELYARDR
ncbi:MAG: GNAT family N-acetyltransferase [Chloroflexota bacterium]|nr:GNAT family N-acetyltransferase [Chloroflexota bacterium]